LKYQIATAAALLMFGSITANAGQPIINLNVGGEIIPGVYGEVQFGNAPPPAVIYAQPVIIEHEHSRHHEEPLYLYVPPGYAKHWSRHCREYDACDREVYFVRSSENTPGFREHDHGHHHDHGDDHDDEDD
jgi:hypothetical protein